MTSLIIFTIGMPLNIATIYIYTRNKNLRQNKIFELILAVLDVISLLVPMWWKTYFLYMGSIDIYSYAFVIVLSSALSQGYYMTILCSTICRYVAVFHPFKFKVFIEKWRKRFVVIIVCFICGILARFLSLLIIQIDQVFVIFLDLILLTSGSFFAIFVLFARIIWKLSSRNQVGPVGNQLEMVPRGECAPQPVMFKAKHVVAMKTFGMITVCLIVSYFIGFAVAIHLLPKPCVLLYYLNHISNPFIYLFFNSEFRSSVMSIVRRKKLGD